MSLGDLTEGLSAHAQRRPNQPALVLDAPTGRHTAIAFHELDRRANQLGRGLQGLGVTAGDRVLVRLRPDVDRLATVLGLLRLGAVPVLPTGGVTTAALLDAAAPLGLRAIVATPGTHLRTLVRPVPNVLRVTAGARWLWGGVVLRQVVHADGAPLSAEPGEVALIQVGPHGVVALAPSDVEVAPVDAGVVVAVVSELALAVVLAGATAVVPTRGTLVDAALRHRARVVVDRVPIEVPAGLEGITMPRPTGAPARPETPPLLLVHDAGETG